MRTITGVARVRRTTAGSDGVTADNPRSIGASGELEPTVTYVVITPEGLLLTRTADNLISHNEWGDPYQDALWAAVRGEIDPHRGQVGGVELLGHPVDR